MPRSPVLSDSESSGVIQENDHHASISDSPLILTDILKPEVNIAVWQRVLSSDVERAVANILAQESALQLAIQTTPEEAFSELSGQLDDDTQTALCENIAELTEMFSLLLDANTVGIRLTRLEQAMCPRFHFDRVPCRLVTTFHGAGTEWLTDSDVDRRQLGARDPSVNDLEAGLYQHESHIRQMKAGDVALLKGSMWEGNEQNGLIHRSPVVGSDQRRLLLTLDRLG